VPFMVWAWKGNFQGGHENDPKREKPGRRCWRLLLSGDIGRMIVERALKGIKPAAGKLHPQNVLVGPASMYARYLLCMKYQSIGHTPLKEHRKLTGEIIRARYKQLKGRMKSQ